MRTKYLFIFSLLVFGAVLLAACGGTSAAPVSNANSSQNRATIASNPAGGRTSSDLAAQMVEGGSVTVKVTPLQMQLNAPLEFEIEMDTHSVDLGDDMLKAVVLRDDSGREYIPSAWAGPEGGGHHRAGKIKFAPLTTNSKSLTLVVKNVAGVPERLYSWELAQ